MNTDMNMIFFFPDFNFLKFSFLKSFLKLMFKYICLFPIPATPISHPESYPPLALSMGPLYMFFDDPFRYFPPPAPSYLLFYLPNSARPAQMPHS